MYSLLLEIWSLLLIISPYLLFGFLFAGFLSVIISQELIEKNLGNNQGLFSIIKASIFGVPLPLCSCGVIPVFSYLRKHGASKSSTTSFLISTPQTGVDSILVTYSLLGPIFAIFNIDIFILIYILTLLFQLKLRFYQYICYS